MDTNTNYRVTLANGRSFCGEYVSVGTIRLRGAPVTVQWFRCGSTLRSVVAADVTSSEPADEVGECEGCSHG